MTTVCGYCDGRVRLTAPKPTRSDQRCPCCSSRWDLGVQRHWGSHNDWATYLCDQTVSGWLRRLIWRHLNVVLDKSWRKDTHVAGPSA